MGTIHLHHMFFCVLIMPRLLRASTDPVVSPSRLVVKYGDRASANCSTTNSTFMGWEATVGGGGIDGVQFLTWEVDNLTDWEIAPTCFTNTELNGMDVQKNSSLDLTLYKHPDSVSISYINHSGPMAAGHQYELQCQVQNIAPVWSLNVAFYRERKQKTERIFSTKTQDRSTKTPLDVAFSQNITALIENDGDQYWCEATMELGPEGPQPPPVERSGRLNSTVYYKPTIGTKMSSVSITEGDTLELTCRATGNPPPSYHWLIPPTASATNTTGEKLTLPHIVTAQGGEYTCVASNEVGNDTMTVRVEVKVDLLPIIAGLAAVFVVILMVVACFIYCTYYKHTRMGHYQLKDILPVRKNKQVAQPNSMDQSNV